MDYNEAVNTLMSKSTVGNFLMVVIALLVLFLLAGKGVQLWRELFGRPKESSEASYKKHCRESEERFEKDESRIEENREDIRDLKDGLRVSCIANMALLNHAIHDGNTAEMENASAELNRYLINRK